jgi:hypothetical protein
MDIDLPFGDVQKTLELAFQDITLWCCFGAGKWPFSD